MNAGGSGSGRGPAGVVGRGGGPARAGGVRVAAGDAVTPARLPVLAVAGRPNVGKSTLVNRIVGRRAAVVEERPGVTRDRLELSAQWVGRKFTVVDTGGWLAGGDELDLKVSAQAERAVSEADVVLLVVDVTVGVTDEDLAAARRLRRLAARTVVVVNKVDNERRELEAWEFVGLGLGDPVPVSALHGRGTGDLLDLVVDLLPSSGGVDGAEDGADDGAQVEGPRPAGDARPAGGTGLAGDAQSAGDTGLAEGAAGGVRDADRSGVGRALRVDDDDMSDDGGGLAGTASGLSEDFDGLAEVADWLDGDVGLGDAEPGHRAVGRGVTASGDARTGESDDPGTWAGCPAVSLVGRPNVGKSTLFNRLIGDERSVVHDMPGTTRDAIDTVVVTEDGPVRFVDTAGIRRRSKAEEGTEFYAMVRALQAVDRADIAILVIDATVGVTHQDQRLAERIGASGSPVVVVLNKWELLATDERPDVLAGVEDRLAFLGDVPVLKISARTGLGVHKLLPALRRAVDAYRSRIPTGELNRALRVIQQAHPAPGARIRYGVQATSEPPTFTLFCSRRLQPTYLRYVERKLRERFAIGPTPVTFRVRVEGRR